jgi:hypothetical protein
MISPPKMSLVKFLFLKQRGLYRNKKFGIKIVRGRMGELHSYSEWIFENSRRIQKSQENSEKYELLQVISFT